MYYKLNNAYAIRPNKAPYAPIVRVDKKARNFYSELAEAQLDGELTPLTSEFAINRAKRLLLADTTALNWLVATRADNSTKTRPTFSKPTIASDPEIFLQDEANNLIPAFDVLPPKGEESPFFWDGFQAELVSTHGPCLQINVGSIQDLLWRLLDKVRIKIPNADFLAQDSVKINAKGLAPEHLELGCDPSLNLYGVSGDLPANPAKLPWRFAGGHLHFGANWLKNHPQKAQAASKLVRHLDKILAVWSVGAFGAFEQNRIRRRYYGLAGEFRLPPHGLEYRVLSNGWLAHPGIAQLTWEIARVIFQLSPLGLLDFWYGDDELTQNVVNSYDVVTARQLLRKNEKLFKWIVAAANETFQLAEGGAALCAKRAFQLGLEGIEAAVTKPLAIRENWQLDEYKMLRPGQERPFSSTAFIAVRAMNQTWPKLSQKMK